MLNEVLELAVIGSLVVVLMEIGKRRWSAIFASDVNPLVATALYVALNAGNAYFFGGDVKQAIHAGIIGGLATVGTYTAVARASSRGKLDYANVVAVPTPTAVVIDRSDRETH